MSAPISGSTPSVTAPGWQSGKLRPRLVVEWRASHDSSIRHRSCLFFSFHHDRYPRKEAMRPEGKRYFLYCIYSWGSAMTVLVLALAVHFFIDVHTNKTSPHSFFTWYRIGRVLLKQRKRLRLNEKSAFIGWLALALFCTSIVFLLVVNIIFYATTRMKINQQTAYGRTFHRHKGL